MKGKFITFEGGDGVGKSTQVRLLAKKLTELGLKVHSTREPGGEEMGEKIRDVLKTATKIDPICELLLIFAARREHYIKLILPLLKDGYFVISDRFYDSSLVYQGILKNVSFESIMQLKRLIMGEFEPDLTVILDMKAEDSKQRLNTRNLILDEYDSMDQEKRDLVRRGFQKIAEIFSVRSVLINAYGNEEAVFCKIFKTVEKRLLAEKST